MGDGSTETALSFPRQQAVTAKFTNGAPRSFSVAADGSRVAFVRSPAGDDPRTSLWTLDVEGATERLVADPSAILAGGDEQLSAAERARRERTREVGRGIVAYSGDIDLRGAAFALGGRLFVADLVEGGATELEARGPVMVPELDPTGATVAYVSDGDVRVTSVAGGDRPLAGDDDPDVAWGVAEFVAAEEMDRYRGMWWSPDGAALLAARVDNRPIGVWHIADPADPASAPQAVRYPAVGTDNAIVTLHVLGLDGRSEEVPWDRERFPYLLRAGWDAIGSADHRDVARPAAPAGARRRRPDRADHAAVRGRRRHLAGTPPGRSPAPRRRPPGRDRRSGRLSAASRSTASRSRRSDCTSWTSSTRVKTCSSRPRRNRPNATCTG